MLINNSKSLIVTLLSFFLLCLFYLITSKLSAETSTADLTKPIIYNNESLSLTQAKQVATKNPLLSYHIAQYYLENNEPENALVWFKHSSRLGNTASTIYLAHQLIQRNHLAQARNILMPHIEKVEAMSLLVTLAVITGDRAFIKAQLAALNNAATVNSEAKALVKALSTFKITNFDEELVLDSTVVNCQEKTQIFATTLADLQHAKALISQISEHPLANDFCFNTPRYIPISRLHCTTDAEQAIKCEESIWQNIPLTEDTKYLAVMLPKGGANVNAGIMYFDRNDSADVFTHELAHLRGFIDEYPLPKGHKRCLNIQEKPFSYNIVTLPRYMSGDRKTVREYILRQLPWRHLIAEQTELVSASQSGWLVGSPNQLAKHRIGLYSANTCANGVVSAFKPVKEISQLEFFEYPFLSEYKEITTSTPLNLAMPSFHYNVARALALSNEDGAASIWLEQTITAEKNNASRIQKIINGEF